MRIAQVAPLYESVPPKFYGGTERVVSYLTEELVRQGHDVTLFASGDSVTQAHLVAACRRSLRLDEHCIDQLAHQILMLEQVFQRADEFDIIHFHVDYLHFSLSRRQLITHVTTLHGRLDLPDLVPIYQEFRDMPVISISDAQRTPLPWANWQATVHHGVPADLYRLRAEPGSYLAFLGRISPE
ncbi:MAG TPA: glycosyltransferase, partial [Candidatus Udaeobacter sp.]